MQEGTMLTSKGVNWWLEFIQLLGSYWKLFVCMSSCGGRRNKWEFRLTKYCTRYIQKALVRGLKLHITLLVPPCPKIEWVFGHWYDKKTSTIFPDRVNVRRFTGAWLYPVDRLSSGLQRYGALAIISARIGSGPRFPHSMCHWVCRLSLGKLDVICGAQSTLRRWSCSNCEHHC